jgi:hypothetical protein
VELLLKPSPLSSVELQNPVRLKLSSAAVPLLVIGAVLAVPGMYYTTIAALAWWGYGGFAYTDIPQVQGAPICF